MLPAFLRWVKVSQSIQVIVAAAVAAGTLFDRVIEIEFYCPTLLSFSTVLLIVTVHFGHANKWWIMLPSFLRWMQVRQSIQVIVAAAVAAGTLFGGIIEMECGQRWIHWRRRLQ